jgi:predicted O-methyltransferase YrrM
MASDILEPIVRAAVKPSRGRGTTLIRGLLRFCVRFRRDLCSLTFELRGPREFSLVWSHLGSVGGFSTDRAESAVLYALAKSGPGHGVIAEVGSYIGRSTAFLALGAIVGRRESVVAIDPFAGGTGDEGSERSHAVPDVLSVFRHNMERVGVASRIIVEVTSDVTALARTWQHGPIRLLFVDGLHTYDAVTEQLNAFESLLAPDAVIVLDDYFPPEFPGVRRAADEFFGSRAARWKRINVNRMAVFGLPSMRQVLH